MVTGGDDGIATGGRFLVGDSTEIRLRQRDLLLVVLS